MGSSSFFSSSPSTLSPMASPNTSYSILQTNEIANRFQHDYIKQSLNKKLYENPNNTVDETKEQKQTNDEEEDEEFDQNIEEKNDFLSRHLIIYKAFYFLFYGAVGSLFPYLAVFYKQLYLSAQQVGFLIGVRPFIQMGAAPLWGALADTYNVKKIILLMSIGAWLGTNYSISYVRIPPSIACAAVNNTIVRIPPPGRIVNNDYNSALNSTIMQSLQTEEKGARRASSNKRLHSLVTTIRTIRKDEIDNEVKVDDNFVREEAHKDSTHSRDTREKVQSLKVLYPPRERRSDRLVTSIQTNDERAKHNINNGTKSKSSRISQMQRLLAADELEEEFDSFNTDGDYPWSLDTEESTEQKEIAKNNAFNIFIVLIIITILGTVFASPTATLADTATLENLSDKLHQYGFQRVWGALGWGLGAFVVGLIVSYIQKIDCQRGNHVDYILSFYVYAVMMALAFSCALFFKFSPVKSDALYSQSLGEAIKMFWDCQHICFVVTLLFSGASLGFIHTFLFWHLHDLGGTQTLFSVLTAVQCVSEVIMYFASGYLLLKIGYDNVLYIGLASNVVRLFAYSFISRPMYSIPIEILQGISSASIWTSAVCYIGLIPGAPVTLQALLHGIYWGLGHGGGGILGGIMVTYIGSNATFIIYGALCLVNLMFLLLLKYRSKLMELLGNYTYAENIPAGTYILTSMSQRRPSNESGEEGVHYQR